MALEDRTDLELQETLEFILGRLQGGDAPDEPVAPGGPPLSEAQQRIASELERRGQPVLGLPSDIAAGGALAQPIDLGGSLGVTGGGAAPIRVPEVPDVSRPPVVGSQGASPTGAVPLGLESAVQGAGQQLLQLPSSADFGQALLATGTGALAGQSQQRAAMQELALKQQEARLEAVRLAEELALERGRFGLEEQRVRNEAARLGLDARKVEEELALARERVGLQRERLGFDEQKAEEELNLARERLGLERLETTGRLSLGQRRVEVAESEAERKRRQGQERLGLEERRVGLAETEAERSARLEREQLGLEERRVMLAEEEARRVEPRSELGDLAADVNAGIVSPENAEKELARRFRPGTSQFERLLELVGEDKRPELIKERLKTISTGEDRSTRVTVNQQEEQTNRLREALTSSFVETRERLVDEGRTAQRNLELLDQAERGIERFQPGFLPSARAQIGRFFDLLGIEGGQSRLIDATGADLLQAANNELATRVVDELGKVTNLKLQLARETVPGLPFTEEGNRILIELLRRVNRRKIQLANAVDDFATEAVEREELRANPAGEFEDLRRKINQENPIIDEQLDRQLRLAASRGREVAVREMGDEIPTADSPEDVDRLAEEGVPFFWVIDPEGNRRLFQPRPGGSR